MTGPEVITLGCRLNLAESNALLAQLPVDDDVVVINSCAVTNEAVRQSRQAVRQAQKRRPTARIIVTGCAAQVDPEHFATMPEVSAVIGNAEKQSPWLFRGQNAETAVIVADIMAVKETAPHMVTAFSGKTRAFVEIQNGCDHRCTFCIIPYGRGNSRSVPSGSVITHVQDLVDKGFQEVVLTGVDVTSYGHDLPGQTNLGHLVERIIRHVPDLPRLRLSSIDGVEIDDRLFDLITEEPRVMPHIHLSLQSGDNMILKRMKRRHSRELAIDLVARMQAIRPEIAIGADIIAGFPTETDAQFENSLKLIDECNIVHGHIFPYSAKTGTPAALMPQVPHDIIKQRAKALREAATAKKQHWTASLIGSVHNIAVEMGGMAGHAENFAYVELNQACQEGEILRARIKEKNGERLMADILS